MLKPFLTSLADTNELSRRGTSGSTVYIATDSLGRDIAVKVGRQARVSAHAQAERRAQIAHLFGDRLPRILAIERCGDEDIMVMECPSRTTLADLVLDSGTRNRGAVVAENLTTTLVDVWTQTATSPYDPLLAVRRHDLRTLRAVEGLREIISSAGPISTACRADEFVWEGQFVSVNRIARRLLSLSPPSVRVACHGDPQPANVLVDETDRWHLIDWEWSGGHHDWRMMLSHLLGWYVVRDVLDASAFSSTFSDGRMVLERTSPSDYALTARFAPLSALAYNQLRQLLGAEHDFQAVITHIAMLLIREAQGKRPKVAASLIGEALELLLHPEPQYAPALRAFTESIGEPSMTERTARGSLDSR